MFKKERSYNPVGIDGPSCFGEMRRTYVLKKQNFLLIQDLGNCLTV